MQCDRSADFKMPQETTSVKPYQVKEGTLLKFVFNQSQEIDDLKENARKKEIQFKNLKKQFEEAQSQYSDVQQQMESELKKKDDEFQTLHQEFVKLQEKLAIERKKQARYKELIIQINKDSRLVKNKLDKCSNVTDQLLACHEKIEELEDFLAYEREQNDKLKDCLYKQEVESHSLEERNMDSLQQEEEIKDDVIAKICVKYGINKSLRVDLKSTEKLLVKERAKNRKQQIEIDNLRKQLQDSQFQREAFDDQIKSLQTQKENEISGLMKTIQECKNQESELKDNMRKSGIQTNSIRKLLFKVNDSVVDLQKEIKELKDSNVKLVKEKRETTLELEKLKDSNVKLVKEKRETTIELEKLKDSNVKLVKEKRETTLELEKLNNSNVKLVKEKRETTLELETVKGQLLLASEDKKQNTEQLKKVTAEKVMFASELKDCKTQMARVKEVQLINRALENKITQLEKENNRLIEENKASQKLSEKRPSDRSSKSREFIIYRHVEPEKIDARKTNFQPSVSTQHKISTLNQKQDKNKTYDPVMPQEMNKIEPVKSLGKPKWR
nr:myosin-2 heavy chain-like [Nothobranchius furzeri]